MENLVVLQSVRMVMGSVVVENNPGITTLEFLVNLQTATAIIVTGNENLVDARLPNLTSYSQNNVLESNNIRLCPQHSVVPAPISTTSSTVCASPVINFVVVTNCLQAAKPIGDIVASMLRINASRISITSINYYVLAIEYAIDNASPSEGLLQKLFFMISNARLNALVQAEVSQVCNVTISSANPPAYMASADGYNGNIVVSG